VPAAAATHSFAPTAERRSIRNAAAGASSTAAIDAATKRAARVILRFQRLPAGGSPAIPRPVQNTDVGSVACKGNFHDPASGIVGPHAVIEIEIVGRRKWREIVSADGVRTDAAVLSREGLP
jgi:hypothetical protein